MILMEFNARIEKQGRKIFNRKGNMGLRKILKDLDDFVQMETVKK